MFNKTKILGIASALIFINFSSSFAETIVHTTRQYNRVNTNTAKKEITPRKPVPYSWEDALEYAKVYPEDITVHKYGGYKDKFGNFSRMRILDLLGDEGLVNRGDGIFGFPDATYLRLTMNYGQVTEKTRPYAAISWGFNKLVGWDSSAPQILNIVFESGYVKQISTSSEWYSWLYKHYGILVNTWANNRGGYIVLTNEDIWDIYKRGNIANVYVSYGGRNFNFFYSGDKQEEHKKQLTYGFAHIVALLNITPATIEYERTQRKIFEINEYRGKIRNDLKNEVKTEMIKEGFRKEVQDEVREEIRAENEYLKKE